MAGLRVRFRSLLGSDEGQSLVMLAATIAVAVMVAGLVVTAFTKVVDGGRVPLEQCIEHQSCEAAAQAHGF